MEIPSYTIDNAKGTRNCRLLFYWKNKRVSLPVIPKTRETKRAQKLAPGLLHAWVSQHTEPTHTSGGLHELLGAFLALKQTTLKPGSLISLKRHLSYLEDHFGDVEPQSITESLFSSFWTHQSAAWSPKTKLYVLSSYEGFWAFCNLSSPSKGIQRPKRTALSVRGLHELWMENEFLEFCENYVPQSELIIFKLLYWTGMDVKDVWELEKKHIELDGEVYWLRKLRAKAKSNREFINQPLSSKVKPIISDLWSRAKKPSDELVDSYSMTSDQFAKHVYNRSRSTWNRMGKATKQVKTLRHSFAHRHAMRGVPMNQLRIWMGHTHGSRMLEEIYAMVQAEAKWMD